MACLPALEFRRRLRRNSTDAERELWTRLRSRRVGPKFRRQHTVGLYTLDFYRLAARLAIELDGGQHYEGVRREQDQSRDEWLANRGIRVLRFSDREALLDTEAVEESIRRAVKSRAGLPS